MLKSVLHPRTSLIAAIASLLSACSGSSDNKPPTAVNTLPQLTSDAHVTATENRRDSFFALTGSDADGDALRFAVSGADAQHFVIDADTGALRFRQPVNFELPADANGDNLYELTAVVEDSRGGRQSQAMTVEVTDVEFAYEFLSPLPDTIVERERYSRLPIALWMEYDYPEPVLVLCDGEILNPASDSRMTWTGSIQLSTGRVNVNCVFRRGEQVIETHTIPVRHQYVISDNRYLVYDALNDQFMIPHPQRLETLLIDAATGDGQKRYPWIGVVPALQDVVADANIGGALYTADGSVQRLEASGNSVASVTGRLNSDIPEQVQSTLSYDAANNRLYASGSGNTYAQIDLASGTVTDSTYLGALTKPSGSRTATAWDALNNRLFFASGAGTGVEAVTLGGDLVSSYAFTEPQRWGDIQYEPTRDQVFISAASENAILRLDLASGNYTALEGGPALNTPLTLALDDTRDRLAVISGHQLLAVDPDSGARTALFDSAVGEGATPTGFAGIWVALDSTHALAMDRQLGRVYRIDLRTGAKSEHSYAWLDRKGEVNAAAESPDFLSAKDFQVDKAKFNAGGDVAALHLRSRDIGEPENYLDLLTLNHGRSQRIATNADIVDFSFSQPDDQLMVLLRNGEEYSVATYALADGSRIANEALAVAAGFTPLAAQAVDGELYVLGRDEENSAPVFRLLVKTDGAFTTLTKFSDLGNGSNGNSVHTRPVTGINTMYDGTVLALLLPEQTPQFWDRVANQTYEMGFSEFRGTDQPQDFYTIDDYEELYFFRTRAGLHLCWRFHCAIQAN